MPSKRKPTPFERYEHWRNQFLYILAECKDAGIEPPENLCDNYKELALKCMQAEEDELECERKLVSGHQQVHAPQQIKTQMITISIDQKLAKDECVKLQHEIIEVIRSSEYKCMSDVSHKYEYYTKEGWNPHIHIVTMKHKSDGQVAQLIRRKLKDKAGVYRIYVNTLNYKAHKAYLSGEKQEDKMEYVIQDDTFREINGIDDLYIW